MRRTQIYLTDGQGRLLERRSKASGQSVSELIRSAVNETYARRRAMSQQEKTAGRSPHGRLLDTLRVPNK
jgi:hypothetical protein